MKFSIYFIMLIASFSFFSIPVHAQLVTEEAPGPLLTAAIASAGTNAATAGATTFEATAKKILDGLAWSIAKMTVQSITKSTVNWINSGFNGSPAFVSDLKSNLKNLSDAVADDFFDHLNQEAVTATGFTITSPFQDQVNQKLRNEYYAATSYYGISPYTLNQCSQDPDAFINQGKFSSGGFNAWFCASQNPANNPFGAYLQASNALWSQLDQQVQQRKAELDWGKGFLPWRGSCAKTGLTGAQTTSEVSTTLLGNTGADESDFLSNNSLTDLSQAETCHNATVKTPGSVIESQLENSLGAGIEQLNLADSINEIVGALMSQLVNQVLGSGGLLGTSQPSSGGGNSYITQAANPSQYNTLNSSLATGFSQTLSDERTRLSTYRNQWQKIADAATDAQTTCGVNTTTTATLTQANVQIKRADSAIAQIDTITNQITSAVDAGDQSEITSVISQYQSFLSSNAIPSASEYATAAVESSDTTVADDGGTGTDSLYTQAIAEQQSCRGGINI